MKENIRRAGSGPTRLTAGVVVAGVIWLAFFANPGSNEAATSYTPEERFPVAQSAESGVATVESVTTTVVEPASSASTGAKAGESDYFQPRTYDCGTAAGNDSGGYMSDWLRH